VTKVKKDQMETQVNRVKEGRLDHRDQEDQEEMQDHLVLKDLVENQGQEEKEVVLVLQEAMVDRDQLVLQDLKDLLVQRG